MEMKNNLCEMSQYELIEIDGGKAEDFIDKVNPLNALEFVYQVGYDFGASSVKFGRELYDFYRDVKKIF